MTSFADFTTDPTWRSAIVLVKQIYEISRDFPTEEKQGLVLDMRRAANSVSQNIAKAHGENERARKLARLTDSISSLYELLSQIQVSYELRYLVNKTEVNELKDSCQGLIVLLNREMDRQK